MAGRLPSGWVDDLCARISLEEVVAEYVPLKQKGRRFWGCCPFHNEKTPSFSVDPEAQMFYCFGCHKGGTVIQFVMEIERLDFMDAVRMLAERAHIELPSQSEDRRTRTSVDERERIYEANRLAARFFHALLWKEEGAQALSYLYKRGLNDADIRRFGLGASPNEWDGLLRHLTQEGYSEALLEKAGLVVRREGRCFDMFRSRAMFPIIDASGRVLGFGGRAMGDAQPKYLNTAETPVFNKRRGLYALNMAKKERGLGHLVLVEGYMDTVSLRKHGVQGVVATLGTALTQEQAKLIKRYAPEVWVSYDGDSAGQKAALRALDIFDEEGLKARVLDYPGGMDPDDFIRAKGLEGFNALPKIEATDYRLLRARDGLDLNTQEGMTQYAMHACEILKRIRSPIEMENQLRRLVEETGYARETLIQQIGVTASPRTEIGRSPRRSFRPEEKKVSSESLLAQRALLTLYRMERIPSEMVHPDDFDEGVMRSLAEAMLSGRSAQSVLNGIEDEADRDNAAAALNFQPLPETRDEAMTYAEECIRTIHRAKLEAHADALMEEIRHADADRRQALYAQLLAINREIEG